MANVDDKNFGLSEEAFSDLKDKLIEGDEQLFEHVFLRHFDVCLAYVVREDKAPEHLAYDAVMDALLTFRQKIMTGKITYGNLRYLLTRMARQHYYRRANKESATNFETLPELSEVPVLQLDPSATELLQRGWARLSDKCQQLLRAFYFLNQELKTIAQATGRKPEALRKQKQRCVDQLRGLVTEKE